MTSFTNFKDFHDFATIGKIIMVLDEKPIFVGSITRIADDRIDYITNAGNKGYIDNADFNPIAINKRRVNCYSLDELVYLLNRDYIKKMESK